MDKKYEQILRRPHPEPPNRPRMSLSRRAAQFAPFSALTGYDGVIREAARQTEAEIFLDEGEIVALDRCLRQLKAEIGQKPMILVRFFCPDSRKSGGSYQIRRDRVVKIDKTMQEITLQGGEIIQFRHIVSLIRE